MKLHEVQLINRIKEYIPANDKSVISGIGDDTAVIQVPGFRQKLLLTTDTLVEKVHFDLSYSSFFNIGWKLMAVNISDIAAMGGSPKYAVITLGINSKISEKNIGQLYRGIKVLAKKYKVSIVGGDIVRSNDLFFTLDLVGFADKPILRSGAKVGDAIVSIGSLGASYIGLSHLKKYGSSAKYSKSHLQPVPMIKEGISVSKYASSMIDNSDGLARCLLEISEKSNKKLKIYIEHLPYSKGANLTDVLSGGEDYNLIYTAPKNKVKLGTVIGEVTAGSGVVMVDKYGRERKLKEKGYEHI